MQQQNFNQNLNIVYIFWIIPRNEMAKRKYNGGLEKNNKSLLIGSLCF